MLGFRTREDIETEISEAKQKRIDNFNDNLYKNDGYEKIAIRLVQEHLNIEMTPEQKKYMAEMFSRMDPVTITHSIKTAALGESFIKQYNSQGKNFEQDYKISENDFKLGLLIHDSGKITMSKKLILSNQKFTDDDYAEMKAHSLEALDTIKLINQVANENIAVGDVFSSSATTIAQNHHPSYLESGKSKQCSMYCKLAAELDCIEAMSDKDRLYKSAMSKEEIIDDITVKIIDNYYKEPEENDRYYQQKMIERDKMTFAVENYDEIFERFRSFEQAVDTEFRTILDSNKILAENYNEQLNRDNALSLQMESDLSQESENIYHAFIEIN